MPDPAALPDHDVRLQVTAHSARRTAVSDVEVEVIRDLASLEVLRADWDACVESSGGDIYFTTDWLKSWWKHHPATSKPLLLIASAGNRIVGVLPLVIDAFGYPPFGLRVARLAGLKSLFPGIGLPIEDELRTATLTALFRTVARQGDVDAISIFPLSDRDPAGADLDSAIAAVRAESIWAVARNDVPKTHMIQFLPESFDAYLGALSKRRRKGYRNNLTRLNAAMTVTNDIVPVDGIDAAYARFIDLHTRQWQAAGKGGHFSDWPAARAFYGELLRKLAPTGRGVILEFRSGDRLLSSQIGFRQGDRFYWRLCARSLDEDVAKFGIGNLSSMAAIEWLIGQGVRVFEDAAGSYDYKESYGGESAGIRRILLVRPRAATRIGAEALIGVAKALDLFLYRIWFQRVAPRLRRVFGGTPGPLPSAWIRTRL